MARVYLNIGNRILPIYTVVDNGFVAIDEKEGKAELVSFNGEVLFKGKIQMVLAKNLIRSLPSAR